MYVFLVALGLHCCVQDFSGAVSEGHSLVVVPGLFIALASPVAITGSGHLGSVVAVRGL